MIYIVAFAFGVSPNLLLTFIPIWFALGGLVYLVARLPWQEVPLISDALRLVGYGSSGYTHPHSRMA